MKHLLNLVLIVTASFGATLSVPTSCYSQEQTLSISGVTLKVGMPQSVVLESLMGNLKVEKVQDSTSLYIISDRQNAALGGVKFENGKLTLAEKVWQIGDDMKGSETAELLTVIFGQLEQRGLTIASISSQVIREPTFMKSTSELRFAGNRKITISVWQLTGKTKEMQISEAIFLK